MSVSPVFDTYWRFAAERLFMFYRRLAGEPAPWTADPVLKAYRFTNTYRAADRVSQYLISEVQYRADRSQAPDEVFFRTILFKLFNKIETWEALEAVNGPISWQGVDLELLDATLNRMMARGERVYSAAYIMSSPPFGGLRKHTNHLRLLDGMMADRLAGKLTAAASLQSVYELLLSYPGIGRFLAFQFAIDLNYSSLLGFDEGGFVIAGPGAADGISKCFPGAGADGLERIIMSVTERQEEEFERRGIAFPGLFGRPLQPIDCQNLFCEISKYARVAHPEVKGVANRNRIKQGYRRHRQPTAAPAFPPRWGLATRSVPQIPSGPQGRGEEQQLVLI